MWAGLQYDGSIPWSLLHRLLFQMTSPAQYGSTHILDIWASFSYNGSTKWYGLNCGQNQQGQFPFGRYARKYFICIQIITLSETDDAVGNVTLQWTSFFFWFE